MNLRGYVINLQSHVHPHVRCPYLCMLLGHTGLFCFSFEMSSTHTLGALLQLVLSQTALLSFTLDCCLIPMYYLLVCFWWPWKSSAPKQSCLHLPSSLDWQTGSVCPRWAKNHPGYVASYTCLLSCLSLWLSWYNDKKFNTCTYHVPSELGTGILHTLYLTLIAPL